LPTGKKQKKKSKKLKTGRAPTAFPNIVKKWEQKRGKI